MAHCHSIVAAQWQPPWQGTRHVTALHIDADAYAWSYNRDLRPKNTTLIIIDMQTHFAARAVMSIRWVTILR